MQELCQQVIKLHKLFVLRGGGGKVNADMGVSKNRGGKPPKMDGLFHGKPYEQMDDLGR